MSARFAAMATLALAGVMGCSKKSPNVASAPPQSVEVALQVSAISPASVLPDQSVAGKIFGSAFEMGATVQFVGPTEAVGGSVGVSGGNTIELMIPALPLGSYDVVVENPSGERSTLRGGLSVKTSDGSCRQMTVNFDFDRSGLRKDARTMLDGEMACFQEMVGQVRVAGHADARGTTDYNLALGQRRADTVEKYLTRNGVASSRVTTVSYGEERPVNRGQTELAFSQNRRAEISVTE
ncbi:MAG: OmpA family protein [Myxococcota bacterium]